MKKIVGLSTLRAQLTGILSLQLADTITSIAYADISNNEAISNVSEADDSSATATIRITMTPVSLPEE